MMYFFKYQFGFRKSHSTEQAIMEITDNLKAPIDSNFISCGLLLDLSKAFDTVNYQIMSEKLCKYGVRGKPRDWFASSPRLQEICSNLRRKIKFIRDDL